MAARDEDDEEFDLGISLESVAAIVDAARAVQEGEESGALSRADEDEEGLDAEDDENMDEDALRAFISELNEDEQAALIALAWVGRGDYEADDWEEARNLARERNIRDPATYLLGIEMLGDMLEEGLEALGLSLGDVERLTKIREFFIYALENGRIDDLPSSVQGRGMLHPPCSLYSVIFLEREISAEFTEVHPARSMPITIYYWNK